MYPACIRRPAMGGRAVCGGVAEGGAEEVAGQPAEMRCCVRRHLVADPGRLVQHRDAASVPLHDEVRDHAADRVDTHADASGGDLYLVHVREAPLRLHAVAWAYLRRPGGPWPPVPGRSARLSS